jgi:hypothetical protein
VTVLLLGTGQYFPTYNIEGSAIADLEVSPQQRNGPPSRGAAVKITPSTVVENQGRQVLLSAEPREVQEQRNASQQPFVDPAILSFTKPTNEMNIEPRARRTSVLPQISSPVMIADCQCVRTGTARKNPTKQAIKHCYDCASFKAAKDAGTERLFCDCNLDRTV